MGLPKVTYDMDEFIRLTGISEDEWNKELSWLYGLYRDGVIWVKPNFPLTLLHEFVHWVLDYPYRSLMTGSITLFFVFLNELWDLVQGVIFHREWRKDIHDQINGLRKTFNDFLDFALCREVDE